MKTPSASRGALRIIVEPPDDSDSRIMSREPLSVPEAWQIAKAIRPRFEEFAAQYDTRKYWPEVYERVGRQFLRPETVTPDALREALLWKYGHLGKPRIPPAHESLIAQLQRGWAATVAALPEEPAGAFLALNRDFGGKTRFITVAFLVHLLHPHKVPIIDQHNFRAVNALMSSVRSSWTFKRTPSGYDDLALVAAFMEIVIAAWVQRAPDSAPSARDFDKFLMMYGKSIKGAV